MNQTLRFPDFFVLRTPLLPFAAGLDLSEEALRAIYADPVLLEAIFLASPTLHQVFETWQKEPASLKAKDKEKLELTLRKYLLRATYRCTPFGLFAGISCGNWDTKTTVELADNTSANRRTRLDMDYLCALGQRIMRDSDLRKELLFFPNNTLYSVGDKYRYVEYTTTAKGREHGLVSIDKSIYLEKVLQAATYGALPGTLASALVDDEIILEESVEFLNELIDSQVLVSELEPLITGNYMHALLTATGKTKSGYAIAEQLIKIEEKLTLLDQSPAGTAAHIYADVKELVEALHVDFEPNQLFQVDLHKVSQKVTLSSTVQREIEKVVPVLLAVKQQLENEKLKQFQKAFVARYDRREVPLSEVLDVEMGLGYPYEPTAHRDRAPLLADIFFGAVQSEAPIVLRNRWQQRLFEKYLTVMQRGETTLVLADSDVQDLLVHDKPPLPSSMYFSGGVLADSSSSIDNGEFQLICRFIGGPSAANLLGRFCHLSDGLTTSVREELKAEEAEQPTDVFAEIVHINQARIGNISTRPVLRSYEIPIMSQPGVDDEHTLPLQDLMLSVQDNHLVLRSRKLNRRVHPRLSSAHNFSANTLPAYHFLCDLQSYPYTGPLQWNWGNLQSAAYLPRVVYNKTILAPAQWQLSPAEQATLLAAHPSELLTAVESLRQARNLPKNILLLKGDNKLPIDLTNPQALAILRSVLSDRSPLRIEECLFTLDNMFVNSPMGIFTNEILIPLHFSRSVSTPPPTIATPILSQTRRNFSLGSEWLYLKLYCGLHTADQLLSEVVLPLTENLLTEGVIDQWFFIRYSDPSAHIRIRFHGAGMFYSRIIEEMERRLSPYIAAGVVLGIQSDIYVRELERYGSENIESTEALFYHDSVATLKVLSLLSVEEGDQIRWRLVLRSIDSMLNDFSYDINQKHYLLNWLQNIFKEEFNGNNPISKKLYANKYRKERYIIEEILNYDLDNENELEPALKIFKERSNNWTSVVKEIKCKAESNQLSVNLPTLLASYTHMLINRFFRSKQRMHEAVIYDLLFKYYDSIKARTKNNIGSYL